MFVYLITNTVNGKYYVGQTTRSLRARWVDHRSSNSLLGRAIRKYGENSFLIEVLAESQSHDEVKNLEKLWIISLSSYNLEVGYNLTFGGDGLYATEETKQLMSRKRKEFFALHPKAIENLRNFQTGKKRTSETKKLMSIVAKKKQLLKWEDSEYRNSQIASRTGITLTENHKRKLSKGIQASWALRRIKFGPNGRKSA